MTEETTRKKWDQTTTNRGLECRKCRCKHFDVIYTRPKTGQIVRLRQCRNCGKRVITRERADQ